MEQLRYVGKQINPALKSPDSSPIDLKAFHDSELKTFAKLFREHVIEIVRRTGGVFRSSVYKHITPQFNAFECLFDGLTYLKGDSIIVTNVSDSDEEFLVRVQSRIPVSNKGSVLFTKPVEVYSNSYALVSFYIGLCKDFTMLSKEDELTKFSMNEFDFPEFLTPAGIIATEAKKTGAKENVIDDAAFDPDVAIPEVIELLRLERRYCYAGGLKNMTRRFYQSMEGFLVRIEIDGYNQNTGRVGV
jgi:hypothetical protein